MERATPVLSYATDALLTFSDSAFVRAEIAMDALARELLVKHGLLH
jgi:hypothetical protein